MNITNTHYANILSKFKIEWGNYDKWKKDDDLDVPVINDKKNYRKVSKWVSIFF